MQLAAASVLALASGVFAQNVVEFNVTRGVPGVHLGSVPVLGKRAATHSERLINFMAGGGYYARVSLGTPPQVVTMLLDTGSSDAWVLSHKADLCVDDDLQQEAGLICVDTFNPSKSSTHKVVDPRGFRITYLDGGVASGGWMQDDFSIGGTTIKSLQLAYVTKAVRNTGILGLGFSASEKAATKYPNIIDQLSNQNLISSKAFSLYLNDRRTDAGSILFGGIDTDKFIGPLQIIPLLATNGTYTSFEIDFSSLIVTLPNSTTLDIPTAMLDHPAPAVLDSGTTLSYLPDDMVDILTQNLSTYFDAELGMILIDCSYLTSPPSPSSLSFQFLFLNSTASIRVPVWEMVLDVLSPSYVPPDNAPFKDACLFGIQSTEIFETTGTVKQPNFTLLGDTFLRSAYVVFDLGNYEVGMGQANLNSSSSRIIELREEGGKDGDAGNNATETEAATKTKKGGGLPSVTGVLAQQTTFTPTAGPVMTLATTKNTAVRFGTGMGEMMAVVGISTFFAVLGGALMAL
ncbi:aspartic peptidase domain-containing protein [Triangularia setosa]|uniref:Aspartic peptidase domain-containing protein n=1 Tax=Triangularia setosa TaxID=2587417 RepID=A0AAN7AA25_9PEZI|nr:aspartic peptidase domain-containing protein [Podospora setosa]